MNEKLRQFTTSLRLNKGASERQISLLKNEVGVDLPTDYLDFLKFSNGAKGEIGENFLEIWSAEEVKPSNDELLVEEFVPGLLLFAGDGANELYAFDTKTDNTSIVRVPMVGMSYEDTKFCANTFTEFLENLFSSKT